MIPESPVFRHGEYVNVLCDADSIGENGRYKGKPDLVVEVISESTRNMDMVKKLNLYTLANINEYWLANPKNKEIYIYSFESGNISNYCVFTEKQEAQSQVFPGLIVQLNSVFAV